MAAMGEVESCDVHSGRYGFVQSLSTLSGGADRCYNLSLSIC